MKQLFSLATFAVLGATSAFAQDKRIQTLPFDSDAVVQIVGREGIQSTIEFGDDERIENVAVGNSSAWEITPNRRASLLFLKPLLRFTRTNMTVVTDRHIYMFDLLAGQKRGSPVYALKFTYPNDKAQVASEPAQLAEAPPSSPPFSPDQLNFGWRTKGPGKLLPSKVFDDGKVLYLGWDGAATLPAILTVSSDGREGPVNYRTAGDFIVVDPLPTNILLREGKRSAAIWQTGAIRSPIPASNNLVAASPAATTRAVAHPSASAGVPVPDVGALTSTRLSGGNDAQ
jgi:type IV secretion system protein VirB9